MFVGKMRDHDLAVFSVVGEPSDGSADERRGFEVGQILPRG
jgi:hypothetical protein